jgi:hypothetical protein
MPDRRKDVARQNQMEEDESLTRALQPFLPIAREFVKNQGEGLKLAQTQAGSMVKLQENALTHEDKQRRRTFWLIILFLLPIVLTVLGTAVGLIFYKGKDEAGILLLTHLAALIVGLVTGLGYQKLHKTDKPQ